MSASPTAAPRHPSTTPDVARAAWGTVCLLAPGLVERSLAGREPDVRARRVVRVLGARHLVQAAGARLLPPHLAVGGGAAVDAVHALTAAAFGLGDARRRRAALADAAVAAGWCVWGVRRYRRLP
ncbi:hypothetical protein WDZ17_14645 [Pseudokineococcus basanitobsidens]|uniref:Uncharacterized protein n=1 Tax=Pseudokineococcus basanitobsidens TaxID=1926649 RepID=A0ABU8RNL1_9ACTN